MTGSIARSLQQINGDLGSIVAASQVVTRAGPRAAPGGIGRGDRWRPFASLSLRPIWIEQYGSVPVPLPGPGQLS